MPVGHRSTEDTIDQERHDELFRGARAYFRGPGYASATARELGETLGVKERELPAFSEILHELEEDGTAIHLEGRGWFSPRKEGWVAGTLVVNRRGFGFLRPVDEDPLGDIFVPASKLKDAHHGDMVLIRVKKKGGGGPRGGGDGREGRVIDVLRRNPRIILGRFFADPKGGGVVEPLRHESVREIHIEAGLERGAVNGERVLTRLREGPSIGGLPPGEVVEVALPEGTGRADLQIVAAEFDLQPEFPVEVEEAAAALPDGITDEEIARRSDRRDIAFFTIDPSDAKDHDDAIAVELRDGGGWHLGVAIADVSHFVAKNGEIDREAYRRATSVYLPGLTVPMLPERLSNDLCSLRPDVDRFAVVAWIDFDPEGNVLDARLEKAVIRSRRKFSYSEVQELLDGAPPTADEEPYVPTLRHLEALRAALHRHRIERGALDLDLQEMRLRLDDDGEVLDVEARSRTRATHIVEECMLAANEAVARIASARGLAILRRTHDEPPEEDIVRFSKLCRVLAPGVRVDGPRDFQALVDSLGDDPAAPVVQLALLRTLTRAEYRASKGLHFALATDEYCHFTSPIRRYPDLQVHRALDDGLFGRRSRVMSEEAEARLASLETQAEHCSSLERNAEEAEREMSKLRAISWLVHRTGEQFTGVISTVRDNGFFVRLDETLIEGMVHVSTLTDDLYVYSDTHYALRGRHGGRIFRLGDAIEVRLEKADPLHRTIDLRYLQHLTPEGGTKGRTAGGRPSGAAGKRGGNPKKGRPRGRSGGGKSRKGRRR